jgi:hypothetical protein
LKVLSTHAIVDQTYSYNTNVHQSIAEETMQCYIVKCWGSDQSGHSYANKQGQITYPDKDKLGLRKEKLKKPAGAFQRSQEKEEKLHVERFKMSVNTLLSSEAFGGMSSHSIKALIASGSQAKG